MAFQGQAQAHTLQLDAKAPLGDDSAPTPKELFLIALSGCTGMDVVALLKKKKQDFTSLLVHTLGETTTQTHPLVFSSIHVTFTITGDANPKELIEAVQLSQTKYCSVSAMISKSVPIHFKIVLNAQEIFQGTADFATA
jgi:putative redox protein